MISVAPLLLLFFLIPRVIFLNKKRETISANMNYGNICYSCKDDIYNLQEYKYESNDKLSLCKSCKRDKALNKLTNNFAKYKEQFTKYQIKNGLKFTLISLLIVVLFVIFDAVINYFFKTNLRLGTIANVIYLLLTWHRIEIFYRKKRN